MSLVSHGSHPHSLTPFASADALIAAAAAAGDALRQNCSVCAAHFAGPVEVYYCRSCGFGLCKKCFDIDERPFHESQFVVRSPMLDLEDDAVCLRTRPRAESHRLCALYPDIVFEVVAHAHCAEDGSLYFRQAQGGWMNAAHVVSVYPIETPLAPTIKVRQQYIAENEADLLSYGELAACVREALALLRENPPFGAVMSHFVFLPVQIHVANGALADEAGGTNSSSDGEAVHGDKSRGSGENLAPEVVALCTAALDYAVALVGADGCARFSPSPRGVRIPYYFATRLALRAVSVLWHLSSLFPGCIASGMCEHYARVIDTFSGLLATHISAHTQRRSFDAVVQEQWDASPINQGAEAAEADSCVHALAVVEVALDLLCFADYADAEVLLPGLSKLRSAVATLHLQSSTLALRLVQTLDRLLLAAQGDAARRALQRRMVDLDVVELAVHCLARSPDAETIDACALLIENVVDGNAALALMVQCLIVPPLVRALRGAKSPAVVNTTLGALAAVAEAAHQHQQQQQQQQRRPGQGSAGEPRVAGCSGGPRADGQAVFQEVGVVNFGFGPVALCQHCFTGGCGLRIDGSAGGGAPRKMLALCHCPHCSEPSTLPAATSGGATASSTVSRPSRVQDLFDAERLATVVISKVRQHRAAIVEGACRLALSLPTLPDEMVAEALVTLQHATSTELFTVYRSALLLVAAGRRSAPLQRQLSNGHLAGTALHDFLTRTAPRGATQGGSSGGAREDDRAAAGASVVAACCNGVARAAAAAADGGEGWDGSTPSRGQCDEGLTPSPQAGGSSETHPQTCRVAAGAHERNERSSAAARFSNLFPLRERQS